MGAEPAGAERATGAHDEKYFRDRMSELRAKLAKDQADLITLQQKVGQADVQYYADPNKGLQQQYSRSDITKLNEEIQKKQKDIADDEKAIDDLRDELRHEGGEPGWLR
jgi:predicted RNase H-like nuclease (RuvC/YqgF family)